MWSGYHDDGMKVSRRQYTVKQLEGESLEDALALVKKTALEMTDSV